MSSTGIQKRLVRASTWLTFARLLTNISSAVSVIVLARILLPHDFGIVAMATAVLSVASSATELSLGEALINIDHVSDGHLNTVWSINALRGLVVAIVLSALAGLLAGVFRAPELGIVIPAMSLGVLFTSLKSPRISLFERHLVFRQSFIVAVTTSLSTVIASIFLAVLLRSYWSMVIGTILGQLIGCITSYVVAPLRLRVTMVYTKQLWRFSFWLAVSELVTTLTYQLDQIIVGGWLGSSALGLYSVGGKLAQLPGREIVRPLTATLFPAFQMIASDPSRLNNVYRRTQNLITYISMPVGLLLVVLAQPVVNVFVGSKWNGAVYIMQAVGSVTALETFGSLVAPLNMALGATNVLAKRNTLKMAVRTPLILTGVCISGMPGLLAGRCIAAVLGVVVDMSLISRAIGISIKDQIHENRRTIIGSAALVTVTYLIKSSVHVQTNFRGQVALLFISASAGVLTFIITTTGLQLLSRNMQGPESLILNVLRRQKLGQR